MGTSCDLCMNFCVESAVVSLIFERTNTKDYKYTKSNESKLKQYEEKTAPNKLFLATATNWNCELT